MRKLTVKNFSVIKEAELEFGKITVLIGPQSSGKSLLCKLAYFLGYEVIRIAIDLVVNQLPFSQFEATVQKDFERWFPRSGWGDQNWSIAFASDRYQLTVSAPTTPVQNQKVDLSISEDFRLAYNKRLQETLEEQKRQGFLLKVGLWSLAATEFTRLAGRGVWDASTYIPLERSYFVDTQKGYRMLGAEADPISAQFAVVYADSMSREIPKPRIRKFLNGDLVYQPDEVSFEFADGRLLPLSYLSSGSKETLPILAVLDMYEHRRRQSRKSPTQELSGDQLSFFDDFSVEEPEASVFPSTQYALVCELSQLANEANFHPHFTITTHSPYILTAFNDLIKAGYIAAERPDQAPEIEKIIPRQYWIKPGEFAAYAFDGKDGILRSIMDDETKMINGDILDDISSNIADEFGQLLEIQYGG